MPNLNSEQAAALQQIITLVQALDETLECGDSQQILKTQQTLTANVEALWTRLDHDTSISGHDKAIARLLAGAAIKELPVAILDPANYPKLQRELRVLKSSLVLLK